MGDVTPSDSELLAEWLKHRRESAFQSLVVRYASLVHMAAKRTCGDDALAADASQLVFILLAQKAKSLSSRTSLAGWLHLSAILHAKRLSAKRLSEFRKLQHLHSAMEPSTDSTHVDSWTDLQPVLDAAIASLSEKDREAILLRFYRSLSVREVAATLGIATDAAQKRIDRATDRLREKLTRRGVTTAGSFSAVMLAGYASEAQAVVISTTVLSSKAIAASAITPTGIFATLIAMKATSYIAPAIVLLCSGWFLNHQSQAISRLEKKTSDTRAAIVAQAAIPVAATRTSGSPSFSPKSKDRPIDWSQIAQQLSELPNDERYLPIQVNLANRLHALEREELISAWDEIAALDSPPKIRAALEEVVIILLGKIDPGYMLDRFWKTDRNPGIGLLAGGLSQAFGIWTQQDPEKATAWLDSQINAGRFDSPDISSNEGGFADYEGILAKNLLIKDPAAAAGRLSALPMAQRIAVMDSMYLTGLSMDQRVEYAALVRSLTPVQNHASLIADHVFPSDTVDQNDLPQIEEYLQRISATLEERQAVIQRASNSYSTTRKDSKLTVPTREDYDTVRAWVNQQYPSAVDSFTGSKLNEDVKDGVMSFANAAELVRQYHDEAAGDEIISSFLKTQPKPGNRAESLELASRIRDAKLRADLLNQIK